MVFLKVGLKPKSSRTDFNSQLSEFRKNTATSHIALINIKLCYMLNMKNTCRGGYIRQLTGRQLYLQNIQ